MTKTRFFCIVAQLLVCELMFLKLRYTDCRHNVHEESEEMLMKNNDALMMARLFPLQFALDFSTRALRAVRERHPALLEGLLGHLKQGLQIHRVALATPTGSQGEYRLYAGVGPELPRRGNKMPLPKAHIATFGERRDGNIQHIADPTPGMGWDHFVVLRFRTGEREEDEHSKVLGVLCLDDITSSREFAEEERNLLEGFCQLLIEILGNRNIQRQDVLTGLINRSSMDEEAPLIFEDARRRGKTVSVLMIDLDKFKAVNDTYGHIAGDQMLAGAGRTTLTAIRDTDSGYRFGGEELLVLVVGESAYIGHAVAKRIRSRIEQDSHNYSEVVPKITASIGVATDDGIATLAQLKMRADKALYTAKEQGRNCVIVWKDLED